jgi:WhiB family redox-sensing transcriptional regulator
MRVPTQFENPLCSEVDTELFFPDTGKSDQAATAKKICRKCPHLTECFEWALRNERYGVWGASSERDRRNLRAKLNIKLREESVA